MIPKILFVLLLVSVVLISGCTKILPSNQPEQDPCSIAECNPGEICRDGECIKSAQPEDDTNPASDRCKYTAPKEQTCNVIAKKWSFEPSTITAKKGDTIKLTITSTDVTHGFALPDFGVNAQLEPNKQTSVEFTPTRTGTFSFFCNVFCGDGHSGMKGTLIVEE